MEGTSDPAERSSVEQHLATCARVPAAGRRPSRDRARTASLELRASRRSASGGGSSGRSRSSAMHRSATVFGSASLSGERTATRRMTARVSGTGLGGTATAGRALARRRGGARARHRRRPALPARREPDTSHRVHGRRERRGRQRRADAIESELRLAEVALRERDQGARADRQQPTRARSIRRPPPRCRRTSP